MNNNTLLIVSLVCLGLLVLFGIWYFKHSKRLKLPNVYLVTGGVKTGKSAISVGLAVKTYKKMLRQYYLYLPFRVLFHREIPKKPMLYSNIPLALVKYNLLTKDILLRKVRIPNKSVVLIDEVSLLADSMLFNDKDINNQLTLFVKLFGHYSHGGYLIVNTQSLKDCHFAFKRCMAMYLYVHSMKKGFFFLHYKVREMLYNPDSDNTTIVNAINEDIEKSTLSMLFLRKYLKMYDCYCYSIFTDDLCYYVDYNNPIKSKVDSLKCECLITFQDYEKYLIAPKNTERREEVNNVIQ